MIGFPVTTVSVFLLRSVVLVLLKSTNDRAMKIPGKLQGVIMTLACRKEGRDDTADRGKDRFVQGEPDFTSRQGTWYDFSSE
jgi:hypothetical protein